MLEAPRPKLNGNSYQQEFTAHTVKLSLLWGKQMEITNEDLNFRFNSAVGQPSIWLDFLLCKAITYFVHVCNH